MVSALLEKWLGIVQISFFDIRVGSMDGDPDWQGLMMPFSVYWDLKVMFVITHLQPDIGVILQVGLIMDISGLSVNRYRMCCSGGDP